MLAPHAANLLFIKSINFPLGGPTGCGHAQGLCQSLTAAAPGGSGADRVFGRHLGGHGGRQGGQPERGRSADAVRGQRRSYIAERISFKAGGAGQVRAADDEPVHAVLEDGRA